MPGSVSEVQSPPESDEGMMQANGQKRRRTRLLFQYERNAFGREQCEQRQWRCIWWSQWTLKAAVQIVGSSLRPTGISFLSRCFSGVALIGCICGLHALRNPTRLGRYVFITLLLLGELFGILLVLFCFL